MGEEQIIPEYPTYAITQEGYVRDLRTGELKNGHSCNGYRRINLTNQNGSKLFSIHILVGVAFIPNPNNLPEIDHIDRNPANNCANNLRWADDFLQNQNKGNQKNNVSGYKNIACEDNYFRVLITRNGKSIVRKRFQNLIDAVAFRDEMYKVHNI